MPGFDGREQKRKELKRVLKFNVRAKIINLPEENIGENFSDLGFGKDFSKKDTKIMNYTINQTA